MVVLFIIALMMLNQGSVHAWRPLARFLPLGGEYIDSMGMGNGLYETQNILYSSMRSVLEFAPFPPGTPKEKQCYQPDVNTSNIPLSSVLQMDEMSLITQEAHVLYKPKSGQYMYRSSQVVNVYNVTEDLYLKSENSKTLKPFKILHLYDHKLLCTRDGELILLQNHTHVKTVIESDLQVLMDCEVIRMDDLDYIFTVGVQLVDGGAPSVTLERFDPHTRVSTSKKLYSLRAAMDSEYINSFTGRLLTYNNSLILMAGSSFETVFKLCHISKDLQILYSSMIDVETVLYNQYHLPNYGNQFHISCVLIQSNSTSNIYLTVTDESLKSVAIVQLEATISSNEGDTEFKLTSATKILQYSNGTINNIVVRSEGINPLVFIYFEDFLYTAQILVSDKNITSSTSGYYIPQSKIGGSVHNVHVLQYCDNTKRSRVIELRERIISTFELNNEGPIPIVNDYTISFQSNWTTVMKGNRIQILDKIYTEGNHTSINSNSSIIAEVFYPFDNQLMNEKGKALHLLKMDFETKYFGLNKISSLITVDYGQNSDTSRELVSLFPFINQTVLIAYNGRTEAGSRYAKIVEYNCTDWSVRKETLINDVAVQDAMFIFNNYLYFANTTFGAGIINLETSTQTFVEFNKSGSYSERDFEKTIRIPTLIHKNTSNYMETEPKPVYPQQPYIFFATSLGKIYQMSMNGEFSSIVWNNTIEISNSSWIPMSGLFFNMHLYVTYYPGHILSVEFEETTKKGKYSLKPISYKLYDIPFLNDMNDGQKTRWTAELDCYAEYTYYSGDNQAIYKLEMRNVPFSMYDIESLNINNIADMKASDTSGTLFLIDLNGNVILRDITLYPDIRFYLVIAVISLLSFTLFIIIIVGTIPVIVRYRKRRQISAKRVIFRNMIKESSDYKFMVQHKLFVIDPNKITIEKKYYTKDLLNRNQKTSGPHGIMFEAYVNNTPIMLKKLKVPMNAYREDLEDEAKSLV